MMQQRYDAVQSTIGEIQTLPKPLSDVQTREQICAILEKLARQTDLFPLESFNVRPGKSGGIYELYVAPDRSLSLYASAGASGKYQPPHDHTTWAVIAGIRGIERNQFFECLTRNDADNTGTIKFVRAKDVGPGQSVTLSADDFHTIAVEDGGDALHLHLYGDALDTLVGRIGFSSETGGAFTRFMAKPLTFSPWITQAEFDEMQRQGVSVVTQAVDIPDLLAAVAQVAPDRAQAIVLTGVQNQSDDAVEARIRDLHRAGYHNLAVLKPAA